MYTKQFGPFAVSSSTSISNPIFVGDYTQLAIHIASASTVTIDGATANGLDAVIPATSWSAVTLILAAGAYSITPGLRWIRIQRSQSSQSISLHCMSPYSQ